MTVNESLFSISVQNNTIDIAHEIQCLSDIDNMGALVTFSGFVRHDDGVCAMEIEHYPAMTQTALEDISKQAITRWRLEYVRVVHRYGTLLAKEPIVFVATVAAHRADAFLANTFIMDFLKSRAPFWKKEFLQSNAPKPTKTARWVNAKEEDESALRQWHHE